MKSRLVLLLSFGILAGLLLAGAGATQSARAHPTNPVAAAGLAATASLPDPAAPVAEGQLMNTVAHSVSLPLIPRSYAPPCVLPPQLISPTNGSNLTTLIPLFAYAPSGGTAGSLRQFHLAYADNPSFAGETSYWTTSSGSPVTLEPFWNLDPATLHYWHVEEICDSSRGPYSAVFTFTTGSGGVILPAPTLVSPISGTTGLVAPVTLIWNGVAGATEYQLWINREGSGNSLHYVPGTSYSVSLLSPNAAYNWWVNARNDYAYGAVSATWRFYTGSFAASPRSAGGSGPETVTVLHGTNVLVQKR
jgi:hypothetical protein